MDPQKRAIYEEEIESVKLASRTTAPQELTREQVLDSIRKLESGKFEAQKKMYELVRTQKMQPQMVNAVIQMEKLKADDVFFN